MAKLEDQQEGGCTEYANLKSGFLSRHRRGVADALANIKATSFGHAYSFRERYNGIIHPSAPTQSFGLGVCCGWHQPIKCHINALRLDTRAAHLCSLRQRQAGAMNAWTYLERPSR
ncbi:uncharacterized protein ARMOST_01571 [Armillaria ostoyae]|uniref:Uncharacterized protein n=1 Tax=Armillaria ostoyae TaxID=47428 RepID=A0A284QPB7_ARMOS|nr:uncharacterized protein ARMOST_01571 [Armillaria ostoyae]